jgi:hypothetical protein
VGTLVVRRRPIGRLVAAYGLFTLSEYVAWVAILVIAYGRGGATEAGLIAFAQLVPAAAAAPFVASLTERFAPWPVLAGGYAVQGAALAVAAVGAAVDLVWLAYLGSVVASTALVVVRPCQAALLPLLATDPRDLTESNVVLGWVENAAVMLSGLVVGALLATWGPGAALIFTAVAVLLSTALVWRLGHRTVPGGTRGGTVPAADGVSGGRATADRRRPRLEPAPRLLLALLTVQWVLVGALDVLFVVIAIDILQAGEGWVGYLQTAYGAGGLVATGVAVVLIGRRLGGPILASSVVAGAALGLVAVTPDLAPVALLLGVVGAARSLVDVAGRTLLQRCVTPDLLARVFGTLEGLSMVGLALGALLVPALVHLVGNHGAVVGVALVMPLVALLGAHRLLRVDASATVPVVEISLLRGTRLFGTLPPLALETVAGALLRRELAPGEVLIREGESGETYYVIADGAARITRGGRDLGLRRRGDGVGEIALLSGSPRTATVTAEGPLTVYALERGPFLDAVAGDSGTHPVAEQIMAERLRDEDPAKD